MTTSTPPQAVDGRVLDGIERIHWTTTPPLCFVGSVVAALHYLGDPVEGSLVMGVSGGAFKMLWRPGWSPALCDLLIVGEEPIRRTFAALGYAYRFLPAYGRTDAAQVRETFRQEIAATVDCGVPAIALGIVGPPEACVVAGYEEGGRVLRGWSYFQEDPTKYFRAEDWERNCHGLILIGDRVAKPAPRQILKDALQWAIALSRVPTRFCRAVGVEQSGIHFSGLAAYDALIEALQQDDEFPAGDLELLTYRSIPIGNDGIHLLGAKRGAAASFLKSMAEQDLPASGELHQAAAAYAQEAKVLQAAWGVVPYSESPVEERLKLADAAFRHSIVALVREARAHEEQAVQHVEKALALVQ
jgi:hypothetical protein